MEQKKAIIKGKARQQTILNNVPEFIGRVLYWRPLVRQTLAAFAGRQPAGKSPHLRVAFGVALQPGLSHKLSIPPVSIHNNRNMLRYRPSQAQHVGECNLVKVGKLLQQQLTCYLTELQRKPM